MRLEISWGEKRSQHEPPTKKLQRLTSQHPLPQRRIQRVLQERPLRDPNEPLPAKPRQRKKVVEDVVNAGLVERRFVDEGGESDSGDFVGSGTELDRGVKEAEEEGVEDTASRKPWSAGSRGREGGR